MAAAYMVLKQTPRARNQLKRVSKVNWTIQVSDKMCSCQGQLTHTVNNKMCIQQGQLTHTG